MPTDPLERVTCARHGGYTREACTCSTCTLAQAYRMQRHMIGVRDRDIANLRRLLEDKTNIILELRNNFALDRRGM